MSCDSLQEPDTFGAPLGNCLQDLRFEYPVQRNDHYSSCEHLIGEATLRAKKQSPFAESCYPRGTLSQAVDTLYVKAASLRATIPEDHIKNIRLLKKKTKKLFMKNCRFQEQLLSFFMEDVFGQLQLQVCKEMHFVEEFHSLRQKLSRCNSFENALSQFQQLSDFDRCHEGSKQEDAEGWRLGAVSQISCASSAREMKSITRIKRTFYEIGKKGIYKAISELDILLSWIKQFLESIK